MRQHADFEVEVSSSTVGEQQTVAQSLPDALHHKTILLTTPVSSDKPEELQVEHLRRAPVWGVTCNNIAFMAVPRSIPACFAATGWTPGLVCLIYSSVVTFDTGIVLGRICTWYPTLHSFPLMVGEAFAAHARRAGMAEKSWRTIGHSSTLLLQYLTCEDATLSPPHTSPTSPTQAPP